MPEERLFVTTPRGDVSAAWAPASDAFAALVVAHGAGSGMDHPFIVGFARAVNDLGVATLRFNFPYMEAGRRSPDPAGTAVASYVAAFDAATDRAGSKPVAVGGKSYGGRIASMAVAEGMPAAGLVFLAYPLHPPGKPERIRDEHLYGISVPMLFVQGTHDAFAQPDLLAGVLDRLGARAELVAVEGGDHGFKVAGGQRDPNRIGASLAAPVAAFARRVVGGRS
jgi:predicted alpha/beta-hydrolase family hydrolase